MGNLIDLIRSFGMARLTAGVAGTAVMLGLLIFLLISGTKPEMALLYSNLDPQATNQIADQLASRQIDFSMSTDQSQISVPRDQVGPLRLEFAQQGLSGTVPGYDIFDRDQSLGQSSFTQEINKLRAMEGELSRTIASIDNVRGARGGQNVARRRQVKQRREPARPDARHRLAHRRAGHDGNIQRGGAVARRLCKAQLGFGFAQLRFFIEFENKQRGEGDEEGARQGGETARAQRVNARGQSFSVQMLLLIRHFVSAAGP